MPRAHALCQARVDETGVTQCVFVLQLAFQYPGHDLHIAMRMRFESGHRTDDVIIAHQEKSVICIRRVTVMTKAETMPRIQPAGSGCKSLVSAANVECWGMCRHYGLLRTVVVNHNG